MERWREEIEFDSTSMKRIINVIDNYPMSLHDCARIIESVALLCQAKTTDGVIVELDNLTKQYGL